MLELLVMTVRPVRPICAYLSEQTRIAWKQEHCQTQASSWMTAVNPTMNTVSPTLSKFVMCVLHIFLAWVRRREKTTGGAQWEKNKERTQSLVPVFGVGRRHNRPRFLAQYN